MRLRSPRSDRGREDRLSRGALEAEFREEVVREVRAPFALDERGRDVRESDERVESSRRGRDVRLSRDWVESELRELDERDVVVLLPRLELERSERVSRLPVVWFDSFRRVREVLDALPRSGFLPTEVRDLPFDGTPDFELRFCGRDDRVVLAVLVLLVRRGRDVLPGIVLLKMKKGPTSDPSFE